MPGNLRIVYAARTMQDAHLLKNLLEDRGIPAVVTNAVLEGGAGVDILGWPTLARVAVHAENADAGRQVALEFDRATSARHLAPEDEAEEGTPQAAVTVTRPAGKVPHTITPPAWPRCPRCFAPRLTQCPACGTSGTGFPPADTVEPADPEAPARTLLLCLQCDEPFEPEYCRRCEWCGHDFGDGLDVRQVPEVEPLPVGLLVVVGATVLLVVGLIAYFALLLRNMGNS